MKYALALRFDCNYTCFVVLFSKVKKQKSFMGPFYKFLDKLAE